MLHNGMTVVLWICSGPLSLSGARGSAQGFQAIFQRPNPGTDTERAEQPLISSLLTHKYLFETASKGRDLLTDLQMKSCIFVSFDCVDGPVSELISEQIILLNLIFSGNQLNWFTKPSLNCSFTNETESA